MSFNAVLWNCSDDPRKAVKTLTNQQPVSSIRPTESCDILNPTFILDYKEEYIGCNYISVPLFGREYFITDMKIDIGKKIVITCAVDVLSTYWANIKGNEVNVVRQENLKEPYLPDPEYKTYTDFQNITYMPSAEQIEVALANLLNNDYKPFILAYAGGPKTVQEDDNSIFDDLIGGGD